MPCLIRRLLFRCTWVETDDPFFPTRPVYERCKGCPKYRTRKAKRG